MILDVPNTPGLSLTDRCVSACLMAGYTKAKDISNLLGAPVRTVYRSLRAIRDRSANMANMTAKMAVCQNGSDICQDGKNPLGTVSNNAGASDSSPILSLSEKSKTSSKRGSGGETRISHGSHVKLTPGHYAELCTRLGSERTLKEYIDKINDYCAAKGKTFKDWAAVVRTWARKDGCLDGGNGGYKPLVIPEEFRVKRA